MTDRSVLVRLRADISDYQRKMATAAATTAGFAKSLDTADSRMGNIVQTALALAPALVPIGGAGVTAIAGLTTQLGFAVAGAGAAVLAFNGVGDSLKALNEFQLEPTAENFAKMQEEMKGLGPQARDFVLFLDDITPKLQRLREGAQGQMLPEVQEGIDTLLDNRLPQVGRTIENISGAFGRLASSSADALASDDWDDFFDFLETEAEPAIRTFGQTTGNIIEALANTWMAMDPASDQFMGGMLKWSQDLADATEGLDESERFQGFLDYLRENGPQAVETLGALGNAAVSLVEAAAPVGAVALPVIEALADALSTLAESPAGPILIGAAAGMSAISRAVAVFNAANGSALMGLLSGTRREAEGVGKGAAAAGSGLAYLNERAAQLRTGLRLGSAAIGSFALAATDVDDKMGLSNTAMLSMMGLMVGPWGAAIGGATGLVLDFAAANDDLEAAITQADDALASMDLDAINEARDRLASERHEAGEGIFGSLNRGWGQMADQLPNFLSSSDEAIAKEQELKEAAIVARGGLVELGSVFPTVARQAHRFSMAQQRAAAQMHEAREQARETAGSFLTLGEGLDNAKVSLRQWLNQLENQAQALRDFRENTVKAARRGLDEGLIKSLHEMGAAGAMRMRQLANGSEAAIDRANAAFRSGQRETRKLADAMAHLGQQRPKPTVEAKTEEAQRKLDTTVAKLNEIDNTNARPSISVDTGGAMSQMQSVRNYLQSLDGDTATMHVQVLRTGVKATQADGGIWDGGVQTFAAGGMAVPRVSQMRSGGGAIMWNEPETGWETYISGKADQRERNKAIWLQTGARLGMMRQAPAMPAGAGGSNVTVDLRNLRVSGTLDTPWGPADIEGMIDDRIGDYRHHDNRPATTWAGVTRD